jgi:glycosyltransferase involved in cell wall biosynthesis
MIRIVYMIDYYESAHGGTEQQLHTLLEGLDRKRFVPEVKVLRRRGDYLDRQGLPAPHEVMKIGSLLRPATGTKLARLARGLRKRGADVVHTFFPDCSLLGPGFSRLVGARHVTSRRDMGFWYTPAKLFWLRRGVRATEMYLANSRAVAANVAAREGAPACKIRVIPNSLDLDLITSVVPRDVRAALGIPVEAHVIGIAANLRPVKRVDDLLRAVRILVESGRDLHVIQMGENSRLLAEYRLLCGELGIAARVHFLGHLERAEGLSWIAGCDVAVNCSLSEGFSNAILEALALRRPVVATAVGGTLDLLRDGQNGLLVEPADPEALARALATLLEDGDLAGRLAAQGCTEVRQGHEPRQIIRTYESTYEELCPRAAPRSHELSSA